MWTKYLLGYDLETTGTDPYTAIPVAAALKSLNETYRDYQLCDPGILIPKNASDIHGITNHDVKGKISAQLLMDCIGIFLNSQRNPVVGMNIRYDLTITNRFHKLRDLKVLDILVIDRHFDKYRSGSRKLSALAKFYDVQQLNAHFAMDDVETTLGIMLAQIKMYHLDKYSIDQLQSLQIIWHQEWVANYNQWRKREGMDPIDERNYHWPIG